MTILVQAFHQSKNWLIQNPLRWLSLLLIMGLLLFIVALPIIGNFLPIELILIMVFGIGVLFVFWRWPPVGLILTLVGGMLIPFTGPSGINVAAFGIALLVGLWLFDTLVNRRRLVLLSARTTRPLLIFVVITILSFAVGQLTWFNFARQAPLDAQLGGLAINVLAVGAFLVVGYRVRELRWLRWMTWAFLALGTLHIASWIVPGAGPIIGRLFQFQFGSTNNAMFWVWLVALATSQAVVNRKLPMGWRIALGVLVAATLYVAYFLNNDWKSGYVPALLTVAAVIGLRYLRVGLAMALMGIFPAWYIIDQAIAAEEFSFGTRVDAWLIILEMSKKSPFVGFGPANYYYYVPLYRIRGYISVFSSHNQYMDLIAQTGYLGLACILWFAWEVGRLGWRLRNQAAAGFPQAYVYGALGGLIGTLAAGMMVDWFLPFVYNIGFTGFRASVLPWLFLGGLVSLEQITQSQSSS